MALPVWGSLEKATDNDQTIEEAITAAIEAHEADSEAHLDEGESLAAHKAEDVLDHPQGSILPDKISFNDFQFETTFHTLTGFDTQGTVSNSTWPGVTMDFVDGESDPASIKANYLGLLSGSTLDHDVLFDSYFYQESGGSAWSLYAGICNNALTTFYLGFKITGGNLVGYARWSGGENTTAILDTPADGELIFVRVFYDYGGNTIYYYVKGELAATLTPSAAIDISNQFAFYIDPSTEDEGVLRLFRVTFGRSF